MTSGRRDGLPLYSADKYFYNEIEKLAIKILICCDKIINKNI